MTINNLNNLNNLNTLKIINYSTIMHEYKEAFPHVLEYESKDGINTWYGFYNNNCLVGYCTINVQECLKESIFLYNFSIFKSKRGNNYGNTFMNLIKIAYNSSDIYIFCKKPLINYYHKLHFKVIHKYKAPIGQVCMVYIKNT